MNEWMLYGSFVIAIALGLLAVVEHAKINAFLQRLDASKGVQQATNVAAHADAVVVAMKPHLADMKAHIDNAIKWVRAETARKPAQPPPVLVDSVPVAPAASVAENPPVAATPAALPAAASSAVGGGTVESVLAGIDEQVSALQTKRQKIADAQKTLQDALA